MEITLDKAQWTSWQPTCHLRRFDDTDKLTNPVLQQLWTRSTLNGSETETEWRPVPLIWEPKRYNDVASDVLVAGIRTSFLHEK